MMRRLATIVVGSIAFGAPAVAQENTTLFALGGLACADWNRSPNIANAGLKDWFLSFAGHLGADKSYLANPMSRTTPQKAVEWVDAYCKTNPLTGLGAAALTMINELSPP
jgi:hypothetical protein